MMGGISGAGGYTIRDILLAGVPAVLRVDFLATAAIIGAIVLVVAQSVKAPANIAAPSGSATCFGLRIIAVWQHWHLPTANCTNELALRSFEPQEKAPRRCAGAGQTARLGWGGKNQRAELWELDPREMVPGPLKFHGRETKATRRLVKALSFSSSHAVRVRGGPPVSF
jgi:hypothetical protein